jgi:hypothetical protein
MAETGDKRSRASSDNWPEAEIDGLYGLPLEEFTAARNRLARALRAQGRREAAAHVARLTKPSLAAWAVNQVMRTQRNDAQRLLSAGERLRSAHANLAAGRGSADELRAASEAEQAAVRRLINAAEGLLTGRGRSLGDAVVDRVRETLHATAADADTRDLAAGGRLTRESRLFDGGALTAGGTKAKPRRGRGEPDAAVATREAKERLKRARGEAAELRRAAANAARDRRRAEGALARAVDAERAAYEELAAKEKEVEELLPRAGKRAAKGKGRT